MWLFIYLTWFVFDATLTCDLSTFGSEEALNKSAWFRLASSPFYFWEICFIQLVFNQPFILLLFFLCHIATSQILWHTFLNSVPHLNTFFICIWNVPMVTGYLDWAFSSLQSFLDDGSLSAFQRHKFIFYSFSFLILQKNCQLQYIKNWRSNKCVNLECTCCAYCFITALQLFYFHLDIAEWCHRCKNILKAGNLFVSFNVDMLLSVFEPSKSIAIHFCFMQN